MQQRIEQPTARILTGGQARFQTVAKGHQFIDLGDDAVLFGEGWKGDGNFRGHQVKIACIAAPFGLIRARE